MALGLFGRLRAALARIFGAILSIRKDDRKVRISARSPREKVFFTPGSPLG